MRLRIAVGDIDIRLDDVDLTHRQVRGLIRYAIAAAAHLPATETDDTKQPLGFAATIERLPEDIPKDDLSWYFDE